MAKKRTAQDVYALIMPNTPGVDEKVEGDSVVVHHRADRLSDLGWITEWEESDDGKIEVVLTEVGSAIVNYANDTMEDNTFGDEMDRGVGYFVHRACRKYLEEERWDVVDVSQEMVVMENEQGDTRTYTRSEKELEDSDVDPEEIEAAAD